ncbi:MAG: type II secretion system protein GspD, partial [Desulfobacteraceae bacterium]
KENFRTGVRTSLEEASDTGDKGRGGSTGEVELNSDFREELDFWSTLEKNICQIMGLETASVTAKRKSEEEDDSSKDNATQRRYISGDKGTMMIDPSVGTITVSAPLKTHEKIENYIEHLRDEVYKQVVLQVKIVEVRLNDDSSMGINWSDILLGSERDTGTFSGDVHFGEDYTLDDGSIANNVVYPTHKFLRYITMDTQAFSLVVDAMKEYGETNVLSSPKVSILNGHGATLFVGTDNSYIKGYETTTVEGAIERTPIPGTVFSGVGLGVTANIIGDDEVILYIIPSTRELVKLEEAGTPKIQVPTTIRRELATTCRIHDGETLIIGGHIDKVDKDTTNRVPFLGDIPGLGWLFKHQAKSTTSRELVIFITPKILAASP